jgi:MSHA biogenesis protein MshM
MYLEYFGFNELPFTLTPNLHFFCNLASYQEALNVILLNLKNGEGFIKITGEVGTGKTILCRKLLTEIDNNYTTVYIANPKLSSIGLQKIIAQELAIDFSNDVDAFQLANLINIKLLALAHTNKSVVIVIDEAQTIPNDTLESLRLLTNLETESEKLLQIVLFGQPELNRRLNGYKFRQLKQRITFSYTLPPLSRFDINNYLHHRLAMSGYCKAYDYLFTKTALKFLAKASQGIPRLINILCHKALLIAYSCNKTQVTTKCMLLAICGTESVNYSKILLYPINNYFLISIVGITIIFCVYIIMRLTNL